MGHQRFVVNQGYKRGDLKLAVLNTWAYNVERRKPKEASAKGAQKRLRAKGNTQRLEGAQGSNGNAQKRIRGAQEAKVSVPNNNKGKQPQRTGAAKREEPAQKKKHAEDWLQVLTRELDDAAVQRKKESARRRGESYKSKGVRQVTRKINKMTVERGESSQMGAQAKPTMINDEQSETESEEDEKPVKKARTTARGESDE